ncbi:DUF4437 domain-containing protein [Sphingomonas crocodyli]|uniref:DUF4437 domain-containing protein n=1 Tax=Sphingomonas crocodyli TaxID=1979270 RepID=A0A437M6H6_9SPHN|nr:DUF4437 domain-containing protein [Sphingomonas crocodyli]RVT93320.1 DUF4437 domain-containing protein [Sphingomonas crocodyli]
MKLRAKLCLTVALAAGATVAALPAFAEQFGPPTVNQAPPFPVPEKGYEVEGRPGLMHNIPNIEFVTWEAFQAPGITAGLQRRLLSQSPSMDAVAQITYVPAGWTQPAGYDEVDNEIVVLDGDLSIGDEKLTKYSYSYMPAGLQHGATTSRQGAVLLQWYKGAPKFVASATSKAGARAHARVRDWNRYKYTWYVDDPFPAYRQGGNFPGYLHSLMRRDPDTGEMTWMTFVSGIAAPPSDKPGNFGGGAEVHPSFEEYYIPEGTRVATSDERGPTKAKYGGECVEGGVSSYKRGTRGYFWRAAGVAHGTVAQAPPGEKDGDGNLVKGNGEANWGWTLVRTGTRLWATYVTDCTYKTGIEYKQGDWRKYDYDVPRYVPHE